MSGPLDGMVVLDATQMLAGPMAGMRLGDLGADVLKIEPPGRGEYNRTHGFEDLTVGGEMTTFLAMNRNKRSVAIDLKHAQGRDTLLALVRQADVFLQNFRVGTAERLGLGPDDLLAINPRLVYCSINGYGSQGPYRDRPGQDLVLQGYSGSMFSVGAADDPPIPSALWAADAMAGYQAAIGIVAALCSRYQTGVGQAVEVDMLSVVLDAQAQELVTYLNTGRMPTRSAEVGAHASIGAPYGVYRTSDGWLTLAMCHLPNLGEALDDEWLRTLEHYDDGHRHRDAIYGRVREAFVDRPTATWVERLNACGVWAGPVYNYEQLERDPHVIDTGVFVDQPQPSGPIRTVRVPIRMSGTPSGVFRGAPRLGEDTAEVLRDFLNYDDAHIERLAAAGAIGLDAGLPTHLDGPVQPASDHYQGSKR